MSLSALGRRGDSGNVEGSVDGLCLCGGRGGVDSGTSGGTGRGDADAREIAQ